ncbi:MAG: TlpA disulfide reductase family protein [Rhodocyclaceae bacterium]|nr:TlpA disulfide reductase family protein [Rhodocyclaceae bacterium]
MTQLATKRRRFLSAGAGLALLSFAPTLWAQGRGMAAISVVPPAPTLRLPDTDNKIIDLAQYRSKVVLVNFWATWCPPCRKEFPSLGRVRKLFKPAEFEVLAVNVGEDLDAVFSFAGNTEFPVLFDRDSKTMVGWSVRGLPTTFLIDRQGRLTFRATGGREFDDPEIVATIKQLLKS